MLEVANWVAVPSAGAMMADLGAEVIKVEPPRGDAMRNRLRQPERESGAPPMDYAFQLDNRGKRSIALSLDVPEARDVVYRLARRADVFTTNLLGERQRRYGLDPEHVRAQNPRIIHTTLTGYGLEGPDADRTAFDLTAFFARGGAMGLVGDPDGPPPRFRAGQGDHVTALNLLAAILAALRLRDRTGEGQTIEVSLLRTAAWTLGCDLSATLIDRKRPPRVRRSEIRSPLLKPYRCGDGRWLNLMMARPRVYWPRLCKALGHPEWETDPRFDTPEKRAENIAVLDDFIEAAFAAASLAEWSGRLSAAGLIWAPVAELQELVDDPQARANDFFGEIDHRAVGRFETLNTPFRIAGADVAIRGPAPEVGEHTAEVLAVAGHSPDEVSALLASEAVGPSARES